MLKVENILLCCSQKTGYSKKDFEDAFTPLSEVNKDGEHLRIAIADGATESSFSKEWANILVDNYHHSDLERNLIKNSVEKWEAIVKQKKLSWFASEKLDNGAHSAFLGVDINFKMNNLRAQAMGDCCLFVIRNEQIILSFPVANFNDFSSNPYLISTKRIDDIDNIKKINFELMPRDMILLASDALSAFILKEKNDKPWEFFLQLAQKETMQKQKGKLLDNWLQLKKEWARANIGEDVDDFTTLVFQTKKGDDDINHWSFINWIFKNWLERQRELGRIKNDDTTLYLIKFKD